MNTVHNYKNEKNKQISTVIKIKWNKWTILWHLFENTESVKENSGQKDDGENAAFEERVIRQGHDVKHSSISSEKWKEKRQMWLK